MPSLGPRTALEASECNAASIHCQRTTGERRESLTIHLLASFAILADEDKYGDAQETNDWCTNAPYSSTFYAPEWCRVFSPRDADWYPRSNVGGICLFYQSSPYIPCGSLLDQYILSPPYTPTCQRLCDCISQDLMISNCIGMKSEPCRRSSGLAVVVAFSGNLKAQANALRHSKDLQCREMGCWRLYLRDTHRASPTKIFADVASLHICSRPNHLPFSHCRITPPLHIGSCTCTFLSSAPYLYFSASLLSTQQPKGRPFFLS